MLADSLACATYDYYEKARDYYDKARVMRAPHIQTRRHNVKGCLYKVITRE